MADELDFVARYGLSQGWVLKPKIVLVEGTTDAEMFSLANKLSKKDGLDLFGDHLAIIAAGIGDNGGTRGVIRELIALRGISRSYLTPSGSPVYRVIGLFDNDKAGRGAVKSAINLDASIAEFKDVFRVQPEMPASGTLDPTALGKQFVSLNEKYKGMDWEIEDALPKGLVDALVDERPNAVLKTEESAGRIHREFTRDGKSQLHRLAAQNAILSDLSGIIDLIHCIRFYFNLPNIRPKT